MRKRLIATVALLSLTPFLCGWVSETGGGVVTANTAVVLTSVEATQVLQSDVLSKLQGETQFGGAVNYASFTSAGVLDLRNVSTAKKIILNRDDSISWESVSITSDDGLKIQDLTRTNGYKFTALRTGNFDVNKISVDTLTANTAYLTSWTAPNNFIVTGNVTADSVSCNNATISYNTVMSQNVTQSNTAHIIATDGTINSITALSVHSDGISADNITALGGTLRKIDISQGMSSDNVTSTGGTFTSLDSTGIIRADLISTTSGAKIGNASTDAVTVGGIVSVNGTFATTGTLKVQNLNTGGNAGTALAVDANGRLCRTGECA